MSHHQHQSLKFLYAAYISTINTHIPSSLHQFLHPVLITHNSRPLTPSQYSSLILPGYTFAIKTLITEETTPLTGTIAARLWITGPEEEGKKRVGLVEHVFYRVEGGRVGEVWSVVVEGG